MQAGLWSLYLKNNLSQLAEVMAVKGIIAAATSQMKLRISTAATTTTAIIAVSRPLSQDNLGKLVPER